MIALKAEHIDKSYAGHTALRNVSIDIQPGRIFGLLGPNGAGKTTLMRILNGITHPDTGHVSADGKPLSKEVIKRIGYLPEERGLYPRMSIQRQLMYLARLKGMKKNDASAAIDKWLTTFDLQDWRKKRIEQLSKGMAQKVQFIATVIHEPDILIMDEPFSGFDPINTQLIRDQLMQFREEGKTILLSTHNMNSVESICEDIALIHQGEVVLQGELQTIQNEYRSGLYEIEFFGNIIGFTNALWAGFELIDRTQITNDHFTARVRMLNDNSINNLLKTVIEDVKIQGIREVIPGMEDIFIETVQKDPADA